MVMGMENEVKELIDQNNISMNGKSSRFPGFYKHDLSIRLDLLEQWYPLTTKEKWMLKRETLTPELADIMVENAIGVFGLPLGVAVNLKLNNRDYIVPMAVEESSVIAALSNSARLIRDHGQIIAKASEPIMFSQVQLVDVKNPEKAKKRILSRKLDLLRVANEQDPMLVQLGGGAKDIEIRIIDSLSGPMVIVHIIVDCRDAMGANVVNTMAETLAPILAELAEGDAICKIVSNLSDRRMVHVRMEVAVDALARAGYSGEQAANRIVKAYHFAEADPYRATTHNKGIMNGIDPILIATGNDWRACEAGAHAYAARSGQYKPLSKFYRDNSGKLLIGEMDIPLALGIVGGVTSIHPGVKILLKLMKVKTSKQLAELAAAAGLLQNFTAVWTLATEGIQKGHMTLHARNVAVFAGAIGEMAIKVANQMAHEGRVRYDRAKQILKSLLIREREEEESQKK